MTDCLIVGAGSSKQKAFEYKDTFTISANLHFPNANCIFAQDDPVLDTILRKTTEGFTTQPVFTTPQKWQKYKAHPRCILFDHRGFTNSASLSSGLNAIVLAQFFGFNNLLLAGFDFEEKPELNYKIKFNSIKSNKIKYVFL